MAQRPLKPLPLCPAAHPPRHSAGFVKPLPRCTRLLCSGGPVCSERCGGRLRRGPPHHLHRGRTAVHRLGRPAGEGGGSRRSRGRRCSKSVGREWLGGVEGRRGRCIQEAGASEARAPACGAGPALPACWPAGMLCCAGPTGAGAPGAPCLLPPAPKPNNRHPTQPQPQPPQTPFGHPNLHCPSTQPLHCHRHCQPSQNRQTMPWRLPPSLPRRSCTTPWARPETWTLSSTATSRWAREGGEGIIRATMEITRLCGCVGGGRRREGREREGHDGGGGSHCCPPAPRGKQQ